MKKSALTILIVFLAASGYAQHSSDAPRKQTKGKSGIARPIQSPALYITASAGLNNNTGICGLNFEIPIEKFISGDIGAGISTWGYKIYFGGKCYLQPSQRGWAFGTGITYNTGLNGFQQNMATIYGNENVKFNLHSISNVLFAAYRYWDLGKRYNRFYAELGWSAPLTTNNLYDEIYGSPLTSQSAKELKLRSPGGPIAAFGFSFAIH